MVPIKNYITDPTIDALCEQWGSNLEKLPYSDRFNLIAGLARGEWPPEAETGDAHHIFMELKYLDWPARVGVIQGITESL